MKTFKKIILLIAIFISTIAFSQQVGNTVLRNKGITTTQQTSLTVTAGEFWSTFNETTMRFEFWDGSSWVYIVIDNSITKAKLAVELKTKVALGNVSGVVNIDASLGIHYTMNMTGNVTNLTFTNLTNEELKTITLEITSDGGSYTFFQPTSIKGDWSAFDSTLTNQIQIYMYDISTPLFTSGFIQF